MSRRPFPLDASMRLNIDSLGRVLVPARMIAVVPESLRPWLAPLLNDCKGARYEALRLKRRFQERLLDEAIARCRLRTPAPICACCQQRAEIYWDRQVYVAHAWFACPKILKEKEERQQRHARKRLNFGFPGGKQ